MKAIDRHPRLELQLIVGASTLLERFGKAVNVIREDGFKPLRTIHYVIEGETLTTQAKSTGLGVVDGVGRFAKWYLDYYDDSTQREIASSIGREARA